MIAIIRIDPRGLDKMDSDIKRFTEYGFTGIKFEIPQVRVLKRSIHGEDIFEFKPILFNYGFLDMPVEYAKNPTTLNKIRSVSEVITGWFYRKALELDEERAQRLVDNTDDTLLCPMPGVIPVLVKSIKAEQLALLYHEARQLDVYDNTEGISIGSYVVLRKYPFDGLSAKILRKKVNGKVQVELLDSSLVVWLDKGSVLYTAYGEDDYYTP